MLWLQSQLGKASWYIALNIVAATHDLITVLLKHICGPHLAFIERFGTDCIAVRHEILGKFNILIRANDTIGNGTNNNAQYDQADNDSDE